MRTRYFLIAAALGLALAAGRPTAAQTPVVVAPYPGCQYGPAPVPTFRWGYFGAQNHGPTVRWHRDYNGQLTRWAAGRTW